MATMISAHHHNRSRWWRLHSLLLFCQSIVCRWEKHCLLTVARLPLNKILQERQHTAQHVMLCLDVCRTLALTNMMFPADSSFHLQDSALKAGWPLLTIRCILVPHCLHVQAVSFVSTPAAAGYGSMLMVQQSLVSAQNLHLRQSLAIGSALMMLTYGADGQRLASCPTITVLPGIPSNCVDAISFSVNVCR